MYQVPADMIASTIRIDLEIQEPSLQMWPRLYWAGASVGAPAAGLSAAAGAAAGAAASAAGAAGAAAWSAAGAAGAAWAKTGATALRLVIATMATAIVSFLKFIFLLRGNR